MSTPTCRHIGQREYLTRRMEQSSLSFQNVSLTSCTRMVAKRMQEQEEDNRIVAKSTPTTMNLATSVSTSSSIEQYDCVEKIGDIKSTLSNHLAKYRKLDAQWCISGCKYKETCRKRRRPGTPELSWSFGMYRAKFQGNPGKLWRLGNRR